jgi:hypothetical protein
MALNDESMSYLQSKAPGSYLKDLSAKPLDCFIFMSLGQVWVLPVYLRPAEVYIEEIVDQVFSRENMC